MLFYQGLQSSRKEDALLRHRRNRFIGDALLNVITLFNQGNGDIADGQVHCHPTKMLSSQALRILTDDPVCAARRHRRLCVRAPHNARKKPKMFKKNLFYVLSISSSNFAGTLNFEYYIIFVTIFFFQLLKMRKRNVQILFLTYCDFMQSTYVVIYEQILAFQYNVRQYAGRLNFEYYIIFVTIFFKS